MQRALRGSVLEKVPQLFEFIVNYIIAILELLSFRRGRASTKARPPSTLTSLHEDILLVDIRTVLCCLCEVVN